MGNVALVNPVFVDLHSLLVHRFKFIQNSFPNVKNTLQDTFSQMNRLLKTTARSLEKFEAPSADFFLSSRMFYYRYDCLDENTSPLKFEIDIRVMYTG